MLVLDTNVISELMSSEPTPAVIDFLDRAADTIALNAISVAEIRYGLALLPNGQRKRRLAEAFDLLLGELGDNRILEFTNAATHPYATICARARHAGRPIAMADAMIAAICHLNGATLVTRNTKDFADTRITTVNPWT
ncbi:MAG: PIN domain-containing protein [Acidimicrobiia bacterium]